MAPRVRVAQSCGSLEVEAPERSRAACREQRGAGRPVVLGETL